PLQANCFILYDTDTKETIVVDPGDEPDRIIDFINDRKLKVKYILCTHAHFDHVGAVPELKEHTGALLLIHEEELEIYNAAKDMAAFFGYDISELPPPDRTLKEGDELRIGRKSFTILHTPGHSPGGICLFGNGLVVTGDTLFAGSVGRTDFHGGSLSKLRESFQRLMSLPEDTVVLPGHGPTSTIGRERRENFFNEEIL
ncbi:MAG TPA: MBL fold metallo-hydrolase, partial [Nitrospirae bacterium]|nr:MBL fold metallo-hydrolase [Nitrospirota bacterium]